MQSLQALRTEIAGQAIALRDALATGPITREDLARRFAGRGMSFAQVMQVIDSSLGRRADDHRSTAGALALRGGKSADMVPVGSVDLAVVTFLGQRVITLAMMDRVHARPDGTAGRNFREHEAKLIEGIDFHRVCADEIRRLKVLDLSPKARGDVVLLTELGYAMLVKSFTDALAWQVQRQMVQGYFRAECQAVAAAQPTPLPVPTDFAKMLGGVVKSVTGKAVAESESRLLAHVGAIVHAEVAGMEATIAAMIAAQRGSSHMEQAMPQPAVRPQAEHQRAELAGAMTALGVVRKVGPAGDGNTRSMAQIVSSGLRRRARAIGEPVTRLPSGRYAFPQALVQDWLESGGRARLLLGRAERRRAA